MMRLIKKRTGIILLLVLAIALSGYSLLRPRITYWAPMLIRCDGLNTDDFSKVHCISSGIMGQGFEMRSDSALPFFCESYAYRSEVELSMPPAVFEKMDSLCITHSAISCSFPKQALVAALDSTNQNPDLIKIRLSTLWQPEKPFLETLFSVLLWTGKARIAYLILLSLVMLTTIFWLFRHKRKQIQTFACVVLPRYRTKIYALIEKRTVREGLLALLFLGLCAGFGSRARYTNEAPFAMPDFIYHSCAVNQAMGDGPVRMGQLHYYQTYRFGDYGVNLARNYKMFSRLSGHYYFHNPPLYSMFLGAVYSVFGINPILIKYFQLLLLLITASLIPLLGYRFWKSMGFLLAMPLSVVFMVHCYNLATLFQPDVLLIFGILLMAFCMDWFHRNPRYYKLVLLALLFSASILLKSILAFVPVLIVLSFVMTAIKARTFKPIIQAALFGFCIVLPVVPWSVYATAKARTIRISAAEIIYQINDMPLAKSDSTLLMPIFKAYPHTNDLSIHNNREEGISMPLDSFNVILAEQMAQSLERKKFVLISTQAGNNAILHAHNEYIRDGGFSGEWFYDVNSFYNHDGLSGRSPWLRVANFYLHHPLMLISLPLDKLALSWGQSRLMLLLLLSGIFYYLFVIFFSRKRRSLKAIRIYILMADLLILILLFLPEQEILFKISAAGFLLCLSLFMLLRKKEAGILQIPPMVKYLLSGLILFIILGSGLKRHAETVEFLIGLCALYAFVNLNQQGLRKRDDETHTKPVEKSIE
jgi:4-amino-4-deoxy-L-arabinose transferase-like glycosyltransferase